MEQYIYVAALYLNDPTILPAQKQYSCGTVLLDRERVSQAGNFYICMLDNPSAKRMFIGVADFTDNENPILCWGVLNDHETLPATNYVVRFDVDLSLEEPLAYKAPSGRFYFGPYYGGYTGRYDDMYITQSLLRPNGSPRGPYGQDGYTSIDSTIGYVAQNKTNFGSTPTRLDVVDILDFNPTGTGKAIQRGKAKGVEWYMGLQDYYGPRGGYRGTSREDGYVEYAVTITRTQPLTYVVNKDTREMVIKYGTTMTPSIKYTKSTSHPVMNDIKQGYTRWANKAPRRFKYDDEFIYVTTLADWLVLRAKDSEYADINSYQMIPRESSTETQIDPESFGSLVRDAFK